MKRARSEYRRLLGRYLAPQRGAVLFMAILLLGSTGLQIAAPQVIGRFLDAVQTRAELELLIRSAILFLALAAAQQAVKGLAAYWSERVAWTATNALRVDLVEHLLRLDLDFHKAHSPGELIERVDGDVNVLAGFFSNLVVDLLGSLLLLIGILAAVCAIDVRLGLALSLFALVALLLLGWIKSFGTRHRRRDREQSAGFYGYLGEVLTATEDLRASGAVPYTMWRFFQHLRGWLPVRRRANLWGQTVWVAALAVMAAGDALAYGLGGSLFQAGSISLGTVYMVIAYVAMLGAPIDSMRTQLQDLQQADAAIARVHELFDIRSRLENGHRELPAGPLAVDMRSVCFGYDDETGPGNGDQAAVIENLSLHLEAGRVLGLLGRTGSGKTTLARLLFRLYDPQQGEVCLGGVNLQQARLAPARARVGLVTQEVQLFEASLRDNLTFFAQEVDDGRLLAVLEALGLRPWLERLPAGLDTPISGSTLSAGEAQIVVLARVFFQDPGLVILDEASSHLDPASEALLERALDRLLAGRTAVIIAHRLATLDRADEILILDRGHVVERGPRAQLAADPGSRFAALRRVGLEEVLA